MTWIASHLSDKDGCAAVTHVVAGTSAGPPQITDLGPGMCLSNAESAGLRNRQHRHSRLARSELHLLTPSHFDKERLSNVATARVWEPIRFRSDNYIDFRHSASAKHSEESRLAARVWTRERSREAYLRRLAIVFADELRLKIVTELYMREMSPKQFYEDFGGGSIPRVDRHFKRLAEHGWLRFVRKETGGSRRGATEHFYRAPELAVFDPDTWAPLPYSIKVAFSRRSFKQLVERITEALQAETFDARPDRHLSWTPLHLDQVGWERVISAVDGMFESLFDEQDDAKLRIFNSGEKPLLATVGLAAFESSRRGNGVAGSQAIPNLVEVQDSPIPLYVRLSKVFADPLCLKIVAELNLREMSVRQFHEEYGGAPISGIRRRFKTLTEAGWLKKTGEKTGGKRRGATEHFFRATGPATFTNDIWVDVPDPIKPTLSWRTFIQLSEQVEEAMRDGTFDARPDRHLTWSLLRLDRQGWEKVVAAIDAVFALLFEEQESARRRMGASGEEAIRATVALAVFESPQDSVKAP